MANSTSRRQLPEVADVVIVGAGPSGATTAKRFIEAGMNVVCLEQGDWPDYTSARAEDKDLELAAGKKWNFSPNIRQNPGDYPIDESNSDISTLMWAGVGGTALLYSAHWMRFMPSDFRVRSMDGVADDWPVSYEELMPFYSRIEWEYGVAGLNGDPAMPGTDNYPMTPTPIGAAGRRVAEGHNKLGWHWWPGANAIATQQYGNMNPCVQLGACMWGCTQHAKSSPDITHWPNLIRQGAHLVPRATVATVEVDKRGLATGVTYFDEDGVEQRQKANAIVLAANGIGTPRILLNSGVANSSGLVGKRLMLHPYSTVVGQFDEPLGSTQGVYGQQIYSLEFYETHEDRGFVRGGKWNLMPTGGPLAMTRPFPWGDTSGIWGDTFHKTVHERLGRSATWGITCEDLPDEKNSITLSAKDTDEFGLPRVQVNYRTSQNSKDLLSFNEERAKESFEAAGATKVHVAPQIRETGWHLLGTTVMGEDPNTSVVDGYGRTHDVPNLYVFDASTFPTSAASNPTATIVAMALRNTEDIIHNREKQVAPW